MDNFRKFRIWTVPGGLFHWVNGVCIICLILLGGIMMYQKELGFTGRDAKIALKVIHTFIGYVFVTNLVIRAISGLFIKSKSIVNSSPKYLGNYLGTILSSNRPEPYAVRTSSKFIVYALFCLLTISAITGLARTGTDLYFPPIGSFVAQWLTESPEKVKMLDPRSDAHTNPDRRNRLNKIKIPIGWLHRWSAYLILPLLLIHIRLAHDISNRKNE